MTIRSGQKTYSDFVQIIDRVYDLLKTKISNKLDLEEVIVSRSSLQAHLSPEYRSKPENFTKDNIIEEFLEFLGYDKQSRTSESELKRAFGRRWPDYKLVTSQDFYILAEAEPLNTDLGSEGKGVAQVVDWIENKACTTNYGLATDGFRWILVEFSIEKGRPETIIEVDLSPFFKEKLGVRTLMHEEDKKKQFLNFVEFFSKAEIEKTLRKQEVVLEDYQEKISKKFYDRYMRLVFGDAKSRTCLVNSVAGVDDVRAREKIAQATVDRLIFIKFIEAKGWMNGDKRFLINLWNTYKKAPTGSFYDSYLKILFFNVLNNPSEQKTGPFAGIKYLNGGLFRKVPEEEEHPDYSIEDDILSKLITFLESYRFEGENNHINRVRRSEKEVMSPEILGYIFERTANHEKGAYYTPVNVTDFITSGTLQPLILDWFNSLLKAKEVYPVRRFENALVDGSLSKEDLRKINDQIQNIKVLDPACGSGAFFMPVIGLLLRIRHLLAKELGLTFNVYKAKKEIIENNIFGVDINRQAIEIAKLRLWLELVSSVENLEEVELLPNIEYNIISGNTLLGFDKYVEIKNLRAFIPLGIDEIVEDLRTSYRDHVSRIKELSENPTIRNILQIKDVLIRLYKAEQDPKSALRIKKIVDQIHSALHATMNVHYLQYLNSKLQEKERIKTVEELERFAPFHWILEFNDVFSDGGFQIVLGNPPYVEFREISYPLSHFETRECGNTYAPFFERAMSVVKIGGYFGYIVPISAVCTDRMKTLQEMLIRYSEELRISNYDDRPDKIFKGLEDCRSSIIFGHRCQSEHRVLSTHYHRWHAEDREELFKHMSFIEVTDLVKPGIIPKIGNAIERRILEKILTNRPLNRLFASKSNDYLIYHNAPRYWIRAMDFMPEFSNQKGATVSPHNKTIFIQEKINGSKEIIAALNSSLFYWFFILNSNCRDLIEREIRTFPLDIDKMEVRLRQSLRNLCTKLMEDYKKHSRRKETTYKRTGKVVYWEFYPKESKPILDEIDDVLAQHYGLSDEEREYIKNFDIQFRMGERRADRTQTTLTTVT